MFETHKLTPVNDLTEDEIFGVRLLRDSGTVVLIDVQEQKRRVLNDSVWSLSQPMLCRPRLPLKHMRTLAKGRHPAGLNFGDCFSYALAKQRGEPLLFKGEDYPDRLADCPALRDPEFAKDEGVVHGGFAQVVVTAGCTAVAGVHVYVE